MADLENVQALASQFDKSLPHGRAHPLLSPGRPPQVTGGADSEPPDPFISLGSIKGGLDVLVLCLGELC